MIVEGTITKACCPFGYDGLFCSYWKVGKVLFVLEYAADKMECWVVVWKRGFCEV